MKSNRIYPSTAAARHPARQTRSHAYLGKPYRKTKLHRATPPPVQPHFASPGTAAPLPPAEEPQLLSDRIFVRHKDQMVKLFLRDILYVEAQRAYCYIKTERTDYLLSLSLGKLEAQLPAGDFLRVHRSYLVNLQRIDAVADGHLIINGRAIPVSKDRREELLQRVNLIQ